MKKHFSKSLYPLPSTLYSKEGFTLVELMIGALLVGVVFLASISMFVAAQKNSVKISEQTINQHNANLTMGYIVTGVRESGGVNKDATFGSATPADEDIAPNPEIYILPIYADIDNSGDLSINDERYGYWFDTVSDPNRRDFKKCKQIYDGVVWGSWINCETITQIDALEFKYCIGSVNLLSPTRCAFDGDGIEIKITSAEGRDYISKVPSFNLAHD